MDQIDIKALRKRIGWRQDRLARYLGISQSSISHLENGRKQSGPVARLLRTLVEAADSGAVDDLCPENEAGR